MSIDQSQYISGMNQDIPLNIDTRAEGAAQIRAVKRILQDSFPNIDGPVTADAATMNSIFNNTFSLPGMVMMWASTSGPLPTGWFPCDGATYTSVEFGAGTSPDLRDRFVKGAIEQANVGDEGGTTVVDITGTPVAVSQHALTIDEIPSHAHKTGITDPKNGGSGSTHQASIYVTDGFETEAVGGDMPHGHIGSSIGIASFSNEPEFYTLLFIIFMGGDAVEDTPSIPYVPTPLDPQCNWSSSPTASPAFTVQFVDESVDPNPSGSITSNLWDFGDGVTNPNPAPLHTYSLGGTYTVSLTVTSSTSPNPSTTTKTIVVV